MMATLLAAIAPLMPWIGGLAAAVIVGLFFSFRSDYARSPDRTRIAVKLTLSSIAHFITLGRSSRHQRSHGRRLPHERRHGDPIDDATISAPIRAVPDPRDGRDPHRRRHSSERDEP